MLTGVEWQSQTLLKSLVVLSLEVHLAAADANDDAKLRRVLQLLPIVMAQSTSTALSMTLSTMLIID